MIYSRLMERRRVFRGEGWFGIRFKPIPSRYYVIRDRELHRPLFSERNGYRPFHSLVRLGRWEAGWFD